MLHIAGCWCFSCCTAVTSHGREGQMLTVWGLGMWSHWKGDVDFCSGAQTVEKIYAICNSYIYIYTQCIWHVENLDFDKVHQIFLNPTHTHNSMQCKLLDWNHQTPQLHSACIQSHTRSNRNLAEIGSQRWHGLLGKARSIWGLRAVILAVKTCLGSLDKLISLEAPGIVILDDVFLSKALP